MELAEELVQLRVLPPKAAVDALHISTATGYVCDYLLTWNCRLISNAVIIPGFRAIVVGRGFEFPFVRSPAAIRVAS